MKCQSQFSGKNKKKLYEIHSLFSGENMKNINNLSSAEFAYSVLSDKTYPLGTSF